MVINQFDTVGVAFLKSEDDPPVRLDRHRLVSLEFPFERMQAVAGDGQSLYTQRRVEDKQNVLNRVNEVGADQAAIFALEQVFEPAMAKALNHPLLE